MQHIPPILNAKVSDIQHVAKLCQGNFPFNPMVISKVIPHNAVHLVERPFRIIENNIVVLPPVLCMYVCMYMEESKFSIWELLNSQVKALMKHVA